VVLVGLYLTVGCFSQDFLIIYFFTIFLTTATQSLAEIAVGAALISGLYGYWLALSSGHPLGAGEWLRLPFFFIVAVFYAYMTEETKQERWRRQQAEHESKRLRFLLTLGDVVAARRHHEELLGQVAAMIEHSFPGVQCVAPPVTPAEGGTDGLVVPVECRGQRYGTLVLSTSNGDAVVCSAVDFAQVAAAVAATALYAGESVRVTQSLVPLKHELLASLSHELRSPLHVILGNADILAEELQPHPDVLVRESVQRLRAGALRLVDLIEALLSFAESRVSDHTPAAEREDLRQLFTELGTLMSTTSVSRAEDLRLRLLRCET
jgi:K+-sensing histidine kinase KdpD